MAWMHAVNHTRGRPRDVRVDDALAQTVRKLLTEVGYASLTMDVVAQRAGVGKAAIYRRYSSKAELVFASVVHQMAPTPAPDTGSLRGDLRMLAAEIYTTLTDPVVASATPGFLAELADKPDVAQRLREGLFAREQAEVTDLLARAVGRGELADVPEAALVHSAMLGSMFAWLSMLHHPSDAGLPAQVADFVYAALAGKPADGRALIV
jgi:AcrR family transcriptional regulator